MAIEPGAQVTALAEDVYDTIRANNPQLVNPTQAQLDQLVAARTQGILDMEILLGKVMTYLRVNLEIKGVIVTTNLDPVVGDGRLIEQFTGGAGSNHVPSVVTDLVSATGGPVTGTIKSDKLATGVGTQSNDGVNRVL